MLWCLLMLLILVINCRSGIPRLSTDLFELLPATELDRSTALAAAKFSHNFSNRVFLLVSAESHEKLHGATEKLAEQLQQDGLFEQVVFRIDPNWLESVGKFYYPYRFQLLGPSDQQLSAGDLGCILLEQSWQILSSPSGLISSEQLTSDPLFVLQRYLQSLPKGASNIKPDDGYLEVSQGGRYYNLIIGLLGGSVMSLENQKQALLSVDSAITDVIGTENLADSDKVEVIRSGMIFHAGVGADNAQQEVSTVGTGSILGILFLILTVFRSVMPLLLCLLSIVAGVAAGYTFTAVLMGPVHIFTLVFGASLIGISVDYSFHYFAEWQRQGKNWSARAALKHIMPGISLGLLTSLLGYIPMLVTPFPGLKQMAVFSSFGLIVAWLTVVAIYPVLVRNRSIGDSQGNWLIKWVDWLLGFWDQNLSGKKCKVLVGVALVSFCAGLLMLDVDDDVRQLQSRSPELVAADRAVRDIVGDFSESRFYLVKGRDPEQLLQREEQLVRLLAAQVEKGDLKSFQAVSEFLPSLQQQDWNNEKLGKIVARELHDYLAELSLTSDAVAKAREQFLMHSDRKLTPEVWLAGPLVQTHGYLWLGQVEGSYFSAVLLAGVSPEWNPAVLAEPLEGVTLVDKTGETSGLFGRYRVLMSWLLVAAYILIAVVLVIRYRVAGAIKTLMPPVLAGLLTLSFLGLSGQPINLFHILALLMVLGIGIDYTLFFREAQGERRFTMMAITLSAITTALSFGLLSLSNTAAISGFGLTVLIGIACCYFLAPFAIGDD